MFSIVSLLFLNLRIKFTLNWDWMPRLPSPPRAMHLHILIRSASALKVDFEMERRDEGGRQSSWAKHFCPTPKTCGQLLHRKGGQSKLGVMLWGHTSCHLLVPSREIDIDTSSSKAAQYQIEIRHIPCPKRQGLLNTSHSIEGERSQRLCYKDHSSASELRWSSFCEWLNS